MALQDKTEQATPRKRQDAREEGQVAKSTDINAGMSLLASLLVLKIAGPFLANNLTSLTTETFSSLHSRTVSEEGIRALTMWYASRFAILCLPIMIGTGAVALAINVLQVGFRVTPKALAPKLTRLDPFKGITRLLSMRSLVELVKSILKIGVVGYFVYAFLRRECPAMIDMGGMPPREIAAVLGNMCWRLFVRGCVVLLIIGFLDYIYQRFHFEQSIKMTKQEVKDEFKRSEGDPQIKGRIRQRQREMARRRMIQDVAKADVIITNPTHIAVALKYDPQKMNAPIVVAKGQRLLAERIKAVAEANRVPIVENRPIARLLYKTVDVGKQIPDDLYQAVAEILAYVFQLNQKVGNYRQAQV